MLPEKWVLFVNQQKCWIPLSNLWSSCFKLLPWRQKCWAPRLVWSNLPFALNPNLAYSQGSMTATSDVKSRLLFFLCLRTHRLDREGFLFAPLPQSLPSSPPGCSVTHTGTQPEGPHRFLALHPPLWHSIHDLIRPTPPSHLVLQYSTISVKPIDPNKRKTQPPNFLNTTYLMYTSTCGCTPTYPNTLHRCAFCFLIQVIVLSHMTDLFQSFLDVYTPWLVILL